MRAKEPIQRRALKMTVVGVVQLVVGTVLNLLSVPIFLRYWGHAEYGAWLAVMAGFTLLRTIDGGYVAYVGNQLNVLYHQDRERMRRTLASSLQVSVALAVLELLVWGVAVWSGKLDALLGVEPDEVGRYNLGPALGVLLLASAVAGPHLGIVLRLFTPLGLLYQATWWGLSIQAVLTLSALGAAWLGASLFQAVLVYGILQAAGSIAYSIYLRRVAPDIGPWWRDPDSSTARRDFVRSLLLTLNLVAQQGTLSGLVVFVSALSGVGSVAAFTTVRTLANVWTMVSNLFATPLFPEIVRFHGVREPDKLFKAFDAHWFFSGLAVNGSMIVLLPYLDDLYAIWTRGALRLEKGLLFCTLASVSLANFGYPLNYYLTGINNLVAQLVTTTTRAAIVFGTGILLFPRMDIMALGVGLLMGELVCSVFLAVLFTNRELARFDVRLPWRNMGAALLATLPAQCLTLQSAVSGEVHKATWLGAFAAFSFAGYLSWRNLDVDVKSRALLLLRR